MMHADDERARDQQREDLPGPSEDPDAGIIGTTDDRSSENRQKGLQKDRENTRDDEVAPDQDQE